jgi:dihydroorotate dehydrogenase
MSHTSAYERFVRPLLFALDPETAHNFALSFLRVAGDSRLLRAFQTTPQPRNNFGVVFPNPIGLAAGFDKNGVALPAWAALGFGFVEIGTVTAKAQPGNPRPRIFRLAEQEALINRLGFNNDGADAIAVRLQNLRERDRWPEIPVGINIGKSKATPIEEAANDYLYSFRRLGPFADYITLNVSSPNTPELRSLQEKTALANLLGAIQNENRSWEKPVLVKVAPDLSLGEIEELIRTCEAHDVSGIIATNTTLDHSGVPPHRNEKGGLSGKPLREKSTEVIRAIRARTQLPIVASGGIVDAETAREKLQAGAQLLQVYTGYIYRGPGLLREIVNEL